MYHAPLKGVVGPLKGFVLKQRYPKKIYIMHILLHVLREIVTVENHTGFAVGNQPLSHMQSPFHIYENSVYI